MAEPIKLATRLDLSAAQSLVSDMLAMKPDGDVVLDASEVIHLGALCSQALLAMATRCKAAGGDLKIEHVSERVEDQLDHMGLSSQKLMEGV